MVSPLGPPTYVDISTATTQAGPGAGQRLACPGAAPTAQPIHCGRPPSPEQHHLCQCNEGVRATPSRVQGLATPVPQAVVGWPAACQLTWRRRVQADYSPGGLSVRHLLPPCRRLEHQATNRPTRTSPPPSKPKGTPAACTPHTKARRYLPLASATAGFVGCQQSGTP